MTEVAKLSVDNDEIELPVVVGTEDEKAVDISKLRGETGYITLDDGYVNTGATTSAITFLDGEKGILRYRGYPIEQLAEKCDFVEVGYLLIYGELPTAEQLEEFRTKLRRHTMLHEDMRLFYDGFPARRPSDGDPQLGGAGRCRRSIRTRSARSDPEQVDNVDPAADGQAADDRGLRLQEVDRPAVRLSAERSDVLRELPADDVRGAERAVRGRSGFRRGARICC